jgi:hypothetical protein
MYGLPQAQTTIGINDIIGQQMQAYALLLLVLSSAILMYVLWNNFVRSPSKKKSLEVSIQEIVCDEGIEPSTKVKRISRDLDELIIIPALAMFYISLSYYQSI